MFEHTCEAPLSVLTPTYYKLWTINFCNKIIRLVQGGETTWELNCKCYNDIKMKIRKGLSPEGGRMFLRNIGIYLQVHSSLLPKRPTLIWKNVEAQYMTTAGVF